MAPRADLPELLARESAWLHRLARGLLSDTNAAADLAQDTMVLALAKKPELHGNANRARGWLRAVAGRLVMASRRIGRTRAAMETLAGSPGETCLAVEQESAERLETHGLLVDAVKGLDEPYRSTVVMRFFADLTPDEIAGRKGVPAATVRQQLKRGLNILRGRLQAQLGRDDWRRALVGLVAPISVWTPHLLGSVAMSAKKIVVVAVVVICIGAGIAWSFASTAVEAGGGDLASALVTKPSTAATREPDADTRSATTEPSAIERAELSAVRIEPGFSIRIVDEIGRPLPGMEVFAWTNQESHRAAQTDLDGQASIAGLSGIGDIYVLGEGRCPIWRTDIKLDSHHDLTVARGIELRGRVRINDAVPSEPILLQLTLGRRFEKKMPSSLFRWLTRRRRESKGAWVRTDPTGRFTFRGLPSAWRANLYFGAQFTLDPQCVLWSDSAGRDAVRLDAGHQDVQLELLELPKRRFRLAFEEDDSPVLNASVATMPRVVGGLATCVSVIILDPEGRFRVIARPVRKADISRFSDPKRRPAIESVTVFVTHLQRTKKFKIGAAELGQPGEIVLRIPRGAIAMRRFRVVDTDGQPIAGAVVCSREASAPTDTEGRGVIALPDVQEQRRPRTLTLGAPGFAFAKIAVPTGAEPWTFVLQPGNRVRVRVRRSDGTVPTDLCLALRYETSPFVHAPRFMKQLHHALMPDVGYTRSASSKGFALEFAIPPTGVLEFYDLGPTSAFRLTVCDVVGTAIVERGVNGVGAIEQREIQLDVPRRGTVIRVIVHDEDGAAIRGARVTVPRQLHGLRRQTRGGYMTGKDGGVTLPPLFVTLERLRATIDKPGFVTVSRPLDMGQELDVRLQRAVRIAVEVVGATGAPVAAQRVWIEGGSGSTRVRSKGKFELRDVRPGRVEVHVGLGCRSISAFGDTAKGIVRVVVKSVGRLEVVRPANRSVAASRMWLTVVGGGAPWRMPSQRRDAEFLWQAPALLPGRYELHAVAAGSLPGQRPDVPAKAVLAAFEIRRGEKTRVVLER